MKWIVQFRLQDTWLPLQENSLGVYLCDIFKSHDNKEIREDFNLL